MKLNITLILFLLISFGIFGQNLSDTIEINRETGVEFFQYGKKLTPAKLAKITASNAEANNEMKIARRNKAIGEGLGIAGGFLIGWTIGTALVGEEVSWELAGIGACLIVIRFPFINSYSNHAMKAVGFYNDGLKQTGRKPMEIQLGLNCNGFGFALTF